MFTERKEERTGRGRVVVLVAGVVILLLVCGFLLEKRGQGTAKPSAVLAEDPYAGSLRFGGLAMSESTSLSGGKSTFVDGTVTNTGGKTVSGATLQVLFANDEGMPAQVETVPLTVIRTREPYVDTEGLEASPLGPGQSREFRLIFEGVAANWNQQMPAIRVARVTAK